MLGSSARCARCGDRGMGQGTGRGMCLAPWSNRAVPVPWLRRISASSRPRSKNCARDHGLPGMLILQFAFDGDCANPYLPHNHEAFNVVYTGTHDNDTTRGWFESLDADTRDRVLDYLGLPGERMPWPLIRSALCSVACLAILPLQDLLELDSSHRMNRPGIADGNWRWQFRDGQPGRGARGAGACAAGPLRTACRGAGAWLRRCARGFLKNLAGSRLSLTCVMAVSCASDDTFSPC